MNIRLHIDDLVLEGFPPGDRYRIAAAVEAGLASHFAEHGVPPGLVTGGTIPSLDGGAFNIASGARPEAIGAEVAKSLYGGLKR